MPCIAVVATAKDIDVRNGTRGTGKSATAVSILSEYMIEKHLNGIANIHINTFSDNKGNHYNVEYNDTMAIINNIIDGVISDCVVLFDELHLFINSLAESIDKIKLFTSVFYQCRKLNISIICAWIRFEDVHLRIRKQFDYVLVPRKYHDAYLQEPCGVDNCALHHYIGVRAIYPPGLYEIILYIFDMNILGKFYNTYEVVKHEDVIAID